MNRSEFLDAARKCKLGRVKVSPERFLIFHRDYLLSFPSIRSKIETVFRNLEKPAPKDPSMYPTPALSYIVGLISTESEPKKTPEPKEEKSESKGSSEEKKSKDPKAPKEKVPKEEKKPSKPYVVIISVKDDPYREGKWENGIWTGNHRFANETDSKRMIDKDTGLPVWREVQSSFLPAKTYQEAQGIADRRLVGREDAVFAEIIGHGVKTKIERADAQARFDAKQRGAATKRVAKVSASLGWGPRTHDYKQYFSGA